MSKWKGWSGAERVEMWRRYKAGESVRSIGLALGRAGGVHFLAVEAAGRHYSAASSARPSDTFIRGA